MAKVQIERTPEGAYEELHRATVEWRLHNENREDTAQPSSWCVLRSDNGPRVTQRQAGQMCL
jgi:hypothetical protein